MAAPQNFRITVVDQTLVSYSWDLVSNATVSQENVIFICKINHSLICVSHPPNLKVTLVRMFASKRCLVSD